MKSLKICLVMFGSHFGTIASRLPGRIRLFGHICDVFYLLINNMPIIPTSEEKLKVVDLKMTMPSLELFSPSLKLTLTWLHRYAVIQLRMARSILIISKDVDFVIFAAGMPFVIPLVLLSKILGKEVVIFAGGSPAKSFELSNPKSHFIKQALKILEKFCYYLSDTIAVETEKSIRFLGLDNFKKKISIFGALIYIDTDCFKAKCDLKDRDNLVGYIGNLESGKGVMNFVEAAKLVLRQCDDVEFLVVGDGFLFSSIKEKLKRGDLQKKVKLIRSVPHNEIPNYLNKLRLLVLPSYSEGLPGIILEGMACETPVLATSVGGIPDIVKDGETGFILEQNTPECIAKNIVRVLNYKKSHKIVKNARRLVEDKYSYRNTVERYYDILRKL